MTRCSRILALLATASITILSTAAVHAADVTWINAAGGDFSTDANWDTGLAPGSGDRAIITLDGTYTVTLDADATMESLSLGAASGTQTLVLASRTLTLGGASVIGSHGAVTMSSSTIAISGATDTLANHGAIVVRGNCAISGAGTFSNESGALLRIEGHASYGEGRLTVANGFTNDGTIEMSTVSFYYGSKLTVSAGTLVNTNLIDLQAGSGQFRNLHAELDNQGTIDVGQTTTIDRAGTANHANSGTINVNNGSLTVNLISDTFTNSGSINLVGGNATFSSGDQVTDTGSIAIGETFTLAFTNTTFDKDAGSITGLGTLSLSGVTANFTPNFTNAETALLMSSSTFNGPGTLTNVASLTLLSSTVNAAFANEGSLLTRGNCAINSDPGEFSNALGALARIEGHGSYGEGRLTVANGFTNDGTIEMSTVTTYYGAKLTVSAGTLVNTNLIDLQAGSGKTRYLHAELDNRGTIDVGQHTTIDRAGAANHANSGTINVNNGDLTVSLISDTFANSGSINLIGGNVTFSSGDQVTNTGSLAIGETYTAAFSGTTLNQNAGSITGLGTLSLSSTTANFATNFTNAETTLLIVSSTFNGPGSLTNAASMTLRGSTINAPFANQGSLLVRSTSAINSAPGEFTNELGGTLRIEGNVSVGYGRLTVLNGFTNEGTIELDTNYAIYFPSLTVTNGTLVNTNLIDVQATAGGARHLYAELDNQGTIDVAIATTVNPNGAADHVNSGTINVTGGDLTFTLTSDTFTNSGDLNIAADRQLRLNGGTFNNFSAGTLTGGTYNVQGTLKFTGADITTNAATIVLDGPSAAIVNQSNTNALTNFAINEAAGSLTITNGRNLTAGGALGNSGDVTITSGCALVVDGVYTQSAGLTTLDGGTMRVASSFDLTGGALAGSGTVDGDLINAGSVTPGASPGNIVVTGDYVQTVDGIVSAELAGPGLGEFDTLEVTGTATLDGELAVVLLNGYEPAIGTDFDILTASSVSGTFAVTNLPISFADRCLGDQYLADSVRLTTLEGSLIVDSPQSQDVCVGDPVTFSVNADGGGTLTYQWRKDGSDIDGETGSSYMIAAAAVEHGGQYDVVVTNLCGSLSSAPAVLTVGVEPAISIDPVSQTICERDPVTFSVTADGTPAPNYQWRKNGSDLPGETNDTLSIAAVTPDDGANYDVVVTNDCGEQISAPVTLTIDTAPAISFDPVSQVVCEGDPVTFTVTASGTPAPTYQWRRNGVSLSGETTGSLTIAAVLPGDAGSYDVVVTNGCGEQISLLATLTVDTAPAISFDPVSRTICEGDPVTFSVTAGGTPTPTYQWRKNGANLPGETNSTLTIAAVSPSDASDYDVVVTNNCGEQISLVAALTVDTAPAISVDPVSQTICEGSPVTLTVTADATPTPTYQWRKGGLDRPGETNDTLTIAVVAPSDAANYDVVVTNGCGEQISLAATLIVDTAPAISVDPVSQTICEGSPVTFTVTANGTPAPTYQWRKDGFNLLGETGATLAIVAVVLGDAGSYDVVVTNACGEQTSASASLTVDTAPAILLDPVSQAICEGGPVTFSVTADGTPAPTYQWRKDGANLPGETNSTLTIAAVTPGDAANYDVVVTNVCGSQLSDPATLAVTALELGDYELDCDVDLGDFFHWKDCVTGADNSPFLSGCGMFDFDSDNDVDLVDFGRLQVVFDDK